MQDTGRATRLSDETLSELRARARREAGRFIDPRLLPGLSAKAARAYPEWVSAVIGHQIHDVRRVSWPELVLLGLACDAEPEPPVPARVLAERERAASEERRRANWLEEKRQEWAALRAALPVKVSVAYNYSGPHHYEFHLSGANHIIVREPLHVGRLRRDADRSLCWTPSRAKHLLFDHLDTLDERIPNCKACLATAARIAQPRRSAEVDKNACTSAPSGRDIPPERHRLAKM